MYIDSYPILELLQKIEYILYDAHTFDKIFDLYILYAAHTFAKYSNTFCTLLARLIHK